MKLSLLANRESSLRNLRERDPDICKEDDAVLFLNRISEELTPLNNSTFGKGLWEFEALTILLVMG